MTKKIAALACVALAAVVSVVRPAHASLIGTSVTGGLYDVTGTAGVYGTANYFDPANGYVPTGYANTSSDTAAITASGADFAFVYGGTVANPTIDSITADLTGSGLTITEIDNYSGGLTGFQTVFTDTAFAGMTVTKTSDTFGNGGFTYSLSGDTLTLTVGPNCVLGTGCPWAPTSTATWSLTPATPTAPEPASVALFGAGLAGLALALRDKRRQARPGNR